MFSNSLALIRFESAHTVGTVNPLYLAFSRPKCISVLLIWRLADRCNVVRYVQRILASFKFSVDVKNAKFAKYKGTLNIRDLQYYI